MNDQEEWLRTLVVRFEGTLLRYARRFIPEAQAREVVQESFLRLWKEGAAKVQGREAEWLFCVCRNQCLDLRKSEAKLKTNVDPLTLESPDPSAHDRLEERERQSAVQRALASLNDNQREVVRLKFQEGFSYKEISRITGHSVSHVGVLIHEAMRRLRAQGGQS